MALLEAHGVAKIFGQLTALSDVDFVVEDGQLHGLIGPNGSGKSTLLKCLAGAELPTRGRIQLGGRDITGATPSERARGGLSLKFQVTSVFPELSVYHNVLLALQAHDGLPALTFSRTRDRLHDRVMEILAELRLRERASAAAGVLSHGEQQWLEIAMALASRPRLLLLDEPTAGMSVEERRATGQLLVGLKRSCSMVVVEHDLDFIREICDVLTVLDQGRVLETGTVEQIQKSRKVQEVYLTRV
jgi:branched-chain amino acid transport system ATP-binding protein/urea transport system ATP-binding protein